jgi:uncharacterized membrane protein
MPKPLRDSPGLTETDRLETFCDGVFAIAITLLVLEIRGPSEQAVREAGGLLPALATLWPSYLGYVISFLTLGIMWANHHSIFEYVRRADRNFLMISVLFLMCVSFLPFPTRVLAEHLADPHERRDAVAFSSATLFVIALAYNAVWRYAVAGGRLLGPDADAEGMRTISRRYLIGPLGYGLSFVLAFISPWTSVGLHVLLAALFALPERKPAPRQTTRSAAAT